MKCVKSGKRLSLAFPLQQQGGLQLGSMPGRINPLRTMIQLNTPVIGDPTQFCTSDDVVTMGLQAGTHWDGLCHASWNGKIYGTEMPQQLHMMGPPFVESRRFRPHK